MKPIRQLLRRPLKTAAGVVLVTLAVAILCLSLGQALAVRNTTEQLDGRFSTVALPLGGEVGKGLNSSVSATVEEALLSWLEQTAEENPHIVKEVARHGILSAYIPELTPLNVTRERYRWEASLRKEYQAYANRSDPLYMPYSCAMLEIRLESVGEPIPQYLTVTVERERSRDEFLSEGSYLSWWKRAEKQTVLQGYTLELTGVVTRAVSLEEGHRDPAGRIARLSITLPTLEALEELELETGENYLVYGMDYVDLYWQLLGEINPDGRYDYVEFEPFKPWQLSLMTEAERRRAMQTMTWYNKDPYAYFYSMIISRQQYQKVNAVSLTLQTPLPLISYEVLRDEETGRLLELIPKKEVTFTQNGETVSLSPEEYTARYQIPTITRLDTTAEAFLASSAGALWQEALLRDEVNNQAFGVVGVNKMDFLADFAREKAKIVEGRDFTEEELAGERVCILHQSLAQANGVGIGDKITLHLYPSDPALPYQKDRGEGFGVVDPAASFYYQTTPFAETAEYTVVGIYRGEMDFPDVGENPYAFSANTVFVPKASAETPFETCDGVGFITVSLENGAILDFHALASEAGYAGRFKYSDRGYAQVASNFHNYEELSFRVLTVGGVLYAVLLLLYLLLYPCFQGVTVRRMHSLGASPGRRWGFVFASSGILLLPGTLLGVGLTLLLWDWVMALLQTTAASALALPFDPEAVCLVAAGQLVLGLAACLIASLGVALWARRKP